MANTSTKNFPHAYGAGRCIAAFSLSHPGGTEEMGEDATDALCRPPVFNMPQAAYDALPDYPGITTSFAPYDPDDPASLGDFSVGYTPDRQPYNATSFGVYCTGSGTTALPYRTAVAPYVPASVSSSLNADLPGTGPEDNQVRPFEVVDQTRLGTTRAQFVVETREGSEPGVSVPVEGPSAYYEVGLNWRVPTIKAKAAFTGSLSSNWPTTELANVRDSLASTLWVSASISDSALSETHPELDLPFFGVNANSTFALQSALTANPAPGTGWEAPFGEGFTFAGDPGTLTGLTLVEPTSFPLSAGDPAIEQVPAFAPKADLMLKIVSVRQRYTNTTSAGLTTPETVYFGEYDVVPVIRVLMPTIIDGTATCSPIPLGRTGVRSTSGDAGLQPPCINVQVWQKNSSATDGTVTPVFDLFNGWAQIGSGS